MVNYKVPKDHNRMSTEEEARVEARIRSSHHRMALIVGAAYQHNNVWAEFTRGPLRPSSDWYE
jgi:hypothetical protein